MNEELIKDITETMRKEEYKNLNTAIERALGTLPTFALLECIGHTLSFISKINGIELHELLELIEETEKELEE